MMTGQDIESFHIVSVLNERAQSRRGVPKRMRTRAKLLAATAEELERVGYEALTVDGIVETAGAARGTFYLYFENRNEAAVAVLRAYKALLRVMRPRGGPALHPFDSIHRFNRYYVQCYVRNVNVLAAREPLMRERPDLADARDSLNHRWAKVVLRDLCVRSGAAPDLLHNPMALLAVRSVLAMADELLRELYVHRSRHLVDVVDNPDQVIEVMSFMWYRALFGDSPPEDRLDLTRPLLQMVLRGGGKAVSPAGTAGRPPLSRIVNR